MKTFKIDYEGELDFATASRLAEAIAESLHGESICLSWYDQLRDHECPAHVSECHDACEEPGFLDYARNRGGQLEISINRGTFIFCFRPLGEFGADEVEPTAARRSTPNEGLQPGLLR